MISNTIFLNESWFLPVIIAALVLLLGFLWKEWAQAGRHRFFIKSVLGFFAVLSLALIALKPATLTSQPGGSFVLLTEGYKQGPLDSLRIAVGKMELIHYEPGRPIPEVISSSEKVFILGDGIKEYDLWQLDQIPVIYIPTDIPDGIIKMAYKEENDVGEDLVVEGDFHHPKAGNRLVLKGPGGIPLDSVLFTGGRKQNFKLRTTLKASGNYLFSLEEEDTKGSIINRDAIPVKVENRKKLKILILNSFPTFETRYLKNFLAEAGHELVVRNQLTRNRYKFEYLNTDPIEIKDLLARILESFDLLIIDAPSLRSFSAAETLAIEQTVRDGLGLFIQPDDSFFTSKGRLNILNFEGAQNAENPDLQWLGINLNRYPYGFARDFGVMEIHSSDNSLISAYKGLGEGKIGTSVFTQTWHLAQEGNHEIYRKLWSRVIEKISKKTEAPAIWSTVASITQTDEPFEFELQTVMDNPQVKTASGSLLPLIQQRGIPFLWKGTTWPREKGWHSLQLDTISTYHYYVEDTTSGTARSVVRLQQANHRYFNSTIHSGEANRKYHPVSSFWFFGLFIICIGGLWLEPKM